ncbi:unnamed protein product [Calypogeia fissa]
MGVKPLPYPRLLRLPRQNTGGLCRWCWTGRLADGRGRDYGTAIPPQGYLDLLFLQECSPLGRSDCAAMSAINSGFGFNGQNRLQLCKVRTLIDKNTRD